MHEKLVADIAQASGFAPEQARLLVVRPLETFIAHSNDSAVVRLSLDSALLAARKAQVAEFCGLGRIERRRLETPRWRLACILAALSRGLPREVTERIVQPNVMAFLEEGGAEIVAAFREAVAEEARRDPSNVISVLVDDARARIISRDRGVSSPASKPCDAASKERDSSLREPPTAGSPPIAQQSPDGNIAEVSLPAPIPARAEDLVRMLDYPMQLLVKELQKVLSRPKVAKGSVSLRPDGTLAIRHEWIHGLGFDPAQVVARLKSSGWLAEPSSFQNPLVLDARVAGLLVGTRGRDLLSAV